MTRDRDRRIGTLDTKLVIEAFSILLPVSFVFSGLFYFTVFFSWGINYFFVATVQDVIMGGIFILLVSTYSFLIFLLFQFRRLMPTIRSKYRRLWFVLIWVWFLFLIGLTLLLYLTDNINADIISLLGFFRWTGFLVFTGVISIVLIGMVTVAKSGFEISDDYVGYVDFFDRLAIGWFLYSAVALLVGLGWQASSRGFLDARLVATGTALPGCKDQPPQALWRGERNLVVRCGSSILIVPSEDHVLMSE